MRAVENADGVSGLEAECEIDLHFYNSCTTGEKRLYSYYRHRGRAHKMGQFLNNKEPYDKYRTVKNGPYFVDKYYPSKAFWEDDYGKYDRGFF